MGLRSLPLIGVPNLLGGASPLTIWASLLTKYGGPGWDYQETSGDVANATNEALALGRDVALNTYADYVAGANWSNPGTEVARHAAGAVETLQQDDILAAGKTYQATVVIANRTAGSVTITDGGAAIAVNGSTVRTITSTGADFIITPTTDFDGDIDCATTLVQQTNILASTAYPGAELLADGDMEAATTAAWGTSANADLSKQTTNPHSGTRLMRIARDGTNDPRAKQASIFTLGKRYRVTGWARSDGNALPNFLNSSPLWTGSTSTDWQYFDVEFTAADTVYYIRSLTSTGTQYTEWDDVTSTEVNPLNGDITGATVGVSIGPGGLLSYSHDATNDYTNVASAEVNSMLNPTQGTLLVLAQVSAGAVWADGIERRLITLAISPSEYMIIRKTTGANEIEVLTSWFGAAQSAIKTTSTTDRFLVGVSYDVPSNALIMYFNGVQNGATLPCASGIVGNLDPATVLIGAKNLTPQNVWSGLLSIPAILRADAGNVMTPAEHLSLAKSLGVA